ncbi:hypothetical protein AURDEDRAFT_124149 [Auricularia subglabra TFB-10046 SS5]|nr:hypothetical protein AURDEDRAFT_124149 [Auricularia subglabra TFB-10046 SS5]
MPIAPPDHSTATISALCVLMATVHGKPEKERAPFVDRTNVGTDAAAVGKGVVVENGGHYRRAAQDLAWDRSSANFAEFSWHHLIGAYQCRIPPRNGFGAGPSRLRRRGRRTAETWSWASRSAMRRSKPPYADIEGINDDGFNHEGPSFRPEDVRGDLPLDKIEDYNIYKKKYLHMTRIATHDMCPTCESHTTLAAASMATQATPTSSASARRALTPKTGAQEVWERVGCNIRHMHNQPRWLSYLGWFFARAGIVAFEVHIVRGASSGIRTELWAYASLLRVSRALVATIGQVAISVNFYACVRGPSRRNFSLPDNLNAFTRLRSVQLSGEGINNKWPEDWKAAVSSLADRVPILNIRIASEDVEGPAAEAAKVQENND